MLAVNLLPTKWSEIHFQNHVVGTLKNSIIDKKPPEVTLLIGTSGAGKTSIAKVLGASILCDHVDSNGDPCGKCESCTGIFSDQFPSSFRLINGRVDNDVNYHRANQELLKSPSLFSKKRVMVIDEAQGLSKEALEVYLSPLEDSSIKDVHFIFCTTEGDKIKKTLSSRTWVFPLKTPNSAEICKILYSIAQSKNVTMTDVFKTQGLLDIASASGGNIRNAMNDLEKILTSKDLSPENVKNLLGTPDNASVESFLISFYKGEMNRASDLLDSLVESEDLYKLMNFFIYKILILQKVKTYNVTPKYSGDNSFCKSVLSNGDASLTPQVHLNRLVDLKTKAVFLTKSDIIWVFFGG